MVFNEFGWINCDAFLDFDGPTQTIGLTRPEGLNTFNSFAFVLLDSMPYSLGRVNIRYPNGEKGKVVYMTKSASHYHIAYQKFVIEPLLEIRFELEDLKEVEIDQIHDYLQQIVEE